MPRYLVVWTESIVVEAEDEEAARERWMMADPEDGSDSVQLESIELLPGDE